MRLQFDDYHINYRSLLQIIDGDEIVFDSRTAQNRRPKAIQSTGPTLRVYFSANYFTNLVGFKARYEFVDDKTWEERPISRCFLELCIEFNKITSILLFQEIPPMVRKK